MQQSDIEIVHPNLKKCRRQYSAGFKNQMIKKKNHYHDQVIEKNNIFEELQIGNLQELYLKQLPKKENNSLYLQQQSLKRLTQVHKINKIVDEKIHSQSPTFDQRYDLDINYEHKAQQHLLKNQVLNIQQKIAVLCSKKYHQQQWQKYFLSYLIQNLSILCCKNIVSNDELILGFNDWLNQNKSILENDYQISKQQFQKITKIAKTNAFIYYMINIDEFKSIEIVKLQQILQKYKNKKSIDWNILQDKFLTHKKYTIPFQFSIKDVQSKKIVDNPSNDDQIQYKAFKANVIPKSVYEKPKSMKHKSQKCTVCQPFTLSNDCKKKMTAEQYYIWDRHFKATQIPKATYHPTFQGKNREMAKIQRSKNLLASAKYPTTMKYLESYPEKNQKNCQPKIQSHRALGNPIPNFQKLHSKEIDQLQKTKQRNKTEIQIKPFNLSCARVNKVIFHQIDALNNTQNQVKQIKFKKMPSNICKSTKKFEAYVEYRKKQKQDKNKQTEDAQKEDQKRNQRREQYKNKLMDVQNNNKMKINTRPQGLFKNKLDLRQIYQSKPLEMDKSSKVTQQKLSSLFEPII